MWRKATPLQRAHYRVGRHPLTVVFAYLTVFVNSICLTSLLENPRRYWDSALALAVNAVLLAGLWIFAGWDVMFVGMLLPQLVASMVGAYLFYAQHNYPDIEHQPEGEWSYAEAALAGSSYMEGSALMHFFSANIGFHHVHHLNAQIPHYQLPKAMAAIPELQNPGTTSLRPKDVLACLRLKLWDSERGRMVTWREARERERETVGA